MISVAKGASADINVQNKDSCYQEGRNLPVCVPGSVQASHPDPIHGSDDRGTLYKRLSHSCETFTQLFMM